MTREATARPSPAPSLVVSYAGASPDSELLGWIGEGLIAGVVIFRENAVSKSQLRAAVTALRAQAPGRLRIMIDEEGGRVRRLPDADSSMGDLRSYEAAGVESVAAAYRRVAERLRGLGIDTLLGPVVDVGPDRDTWLRPRTYSNDAAAVAEMAHAVITAVQQTGVSCCAKHFPGSRAVVVDPHTGAADDPTPPSVWDNVDVVPFRAAVTAGTDSIMVGHQRLLGFDFTHPACLSPVIVSVLLRQRLGFTGTVMTDDLAMGAIAQQYPIETAVGAALAAGCNLVLVCQDRALQRRAVAAWRDIVSRASKS